MKLLSLILGTALMFSQVSQAASCTADPVNSTHGIKVMGDYGSQSKDILKQVRSNARTAARSLTDVAGKVMGLDYTLTVSEESANSPQWPDLGCRVTVKEQIYCSDGKSVNCTRLCNTEKSCIDPR